jgi:hypothetical protein
MLYGTAPSLAVIQGLLSSGALRRGALLEVNVDDCYSPEPGV